MKESPILFSTPMVRAILEDRKTQTRRIIPNARELDGFSLGKWNGYCRYGQLGDHLWVRETWAVPKEYDALSPCGLWNHPQVFYKASADWLFSHGKTRPSIFIPRWASRITLEITNIRVQRLHEITHEDITAEGLGDNYTEIGWNYAFGQLWNSINEKRGYGWANNPWVWAITFKIIDKPSEVK